MVGSMKIYQSENEVRRDFPNFTRLKKECQNRGYSRNQRIKNFAALKAKDYDLLVAEFLSCELGGRNSNGADVGENISDSNNKFWERQDVKSPELLEMCKNLGVEDLVDKNSRVITLRRLTVSKLASTGKISQADWEDINLLKAVSPYCDRFYVEKKHLVSDLVNLGLSTAGDPATQLIRFARDRAKIRDTRLKPQTASLDRRDQERIRHVVFETIFFGMMGVSLKDTLWPARVVREAKTLLQWARLDTLSASRRSVGLLEERISWLDTMSEKFKGSQKCLGENRKDFESVRAYLREAKKQAECEKFNITKCPEMFDVLASHNTEKTFPVYRDAAPIEERGCQKTEQSEASPGERARGRSFRADSYFANPPRLMLGPDCPLRKPQLDAIDAARNFHSARPSSAEESSALHDETLAIQNLQEIACKTIRRTYFEEVREDVVVPELKAALEEVASAAEKRCGLLAGKGVSDASILVLPTGLGKTAVICSLPFVLPLSNSRRVLVLAPNLTIAGSATGSPADQKDPKQLIEGLTKDFGDPELNFYTRKFPGKKTLLPKGVPLPCAVSLKDANGQARDITHLQCADVVITNYHQLQNHKLDKFPRDFFDAIIVDEAHHSESQSYKLIFDYFCGAHLVHLTATPFRSDRQSLSGTEVFRTSIEKCIENKYIKDIAYCPVPVKSFSMVNRSNSETTEVSGLENIRQKGSSRATQDAAVTSSVVRESIMHATMDCLKWLRKDGKTHQAIVQAANIDDARDICKKWMELQNSYPNNDGEFRIDFVSSQDPALTDDEIQYHWHKPTKEVKQQLYDGKLDIIVHVGMLGEGFDHKPLSVAAIFRPFRSIGGFNQFVGRVVRWDAQNQSKKPDSQVAYIISHPLLGLMDAWDVFCEERQDEVGELKGSGGRAGVELKITDQQLHPSIFTDSCFAEILKGGIGHDQLGRIYMFTQHKKHLEKKLTSGTTNGRLKNRTHESSPTSVLPDIQEFDSPPTPSSVASSISQSVRHIAF
eukprot:CAMPEP_0177586720 /NCGR_PEP_ID=MMETSP0419_2-20121207/5225_1 /TAXON_ID=582737 /ORGANISM="Tetraselmis sp., Strain GSL018" /LENGTH=1001 /DNA_ID=CAMNT_0019076635 /DNA_START=386 /DNA_END=3391 /DNA_ORIENTATION=+